MQTAYTSVLTQPWVPTPTDGLSNETLTSQAETEHTISTLLASQSPLVPPTLDKNAHINYLMGMLLRPLAPGYTALDASRPWLIYWSLHSIALIGGELDPAGRMRAVETLMSCQNPDGGFGGGPGQRSHLAPSYAAIMALATAGEEEGFKRINRKGMYKFLLSLKQPDGSFIMHDGGEVDVRGCYCALTIATVLNILTPTLASTTPSFIASCQTYEGGLSASSHPFDAADALNPCLGEAHGGYAFCAVASWSLLRPFSDPSSPAFVAPSASTVKTAKKELDLDSLTRWATGMQAMPIEGGGFRGRTNKLVDGCYGWWGGGIFGVLRALLEEEKGRDVGELFEKSALQEYVLLVAQNPSGGLRDKPGKASDAYHTCYNLSGLASTQHPMYFSSLSLETLKLGFRDPFGSRVVEEDEPEMVLDEEIAESQEEASRRMKELYARALAWEERGTLLIGGEDNELMPTHPVFNLTIPHATKMLEYFYLQK
ncbi:protein farnesyltransferase subunit beta [Pseudohyphozyma bogoriensis]|nr:protein farnesyltransferase subunit beta [Pseudohyphozyma bogoriensis]